MTLEELKKELAALVGENGVAEVLEGYEPEELEEMTNSDRREIYQDICADMRYCANIARYRNCGY